MLSLPSTSVAAANCTGEKIAAIAAALMQSAANGKTVSHNGTKSTTRSINTQANHWKSIARTEAMRDR